MVRNNPIKTTIIDEDIIDKMINKNMNNGKEELELRI